MEHIFFSLHFFILKNAKLTEKLQEWPKEHLHALHLGSPINFCWLDYYLQWIRLGS